MDCSPPGSFVRGILQARTLEYVYVYIFLRFSLILWLIPFNFSSSAYLKQKPISNHLMIIMRVPWTARFLRVPWTAKRSNESILKEINPEYSLKGLMLKLQYFGHLMWRIDFLEKILILGKIEGRRRRRHHRIRLLDGITDRHEFEQIPGIGDGQGSLACCSPWGCKESDIINCKLS